MKKNCELCQTRKATNAKFGVELCDVCYEGFSEVLRGNKDVIDEYSDLTRFPNATDKAIKEIVSLAQKKSTPQKDFVEHNTDSENKPQKVYTGLMQEKTNQLYEDIHQIAKDVRFFKILVIICLVLIFLMLFFNFIAVTIASSL